MQDLAAELNAEGYAIVRGPARLYAAEYRVGSGFIAPFSPICRRSADRLPEWMG
jgi:hypothetical protein